MFLSHSTIMNKSILYFWVFLLCGLVTLKLLFGKKFSTLGIMEKLEAKLKKRPWL